MTTRLSFSIEGAGEAVLLLHGFALDRRHSEALSRALAPTRRVLSPNLPGYGESAPLIPYDLARVTGMLVEDLNALGVRAVDVVGISFGAYRALLLALDRRVAVRSIFTLAGLATVPAEARAGFRTGASALEAGHDLWPALVAGGFSEGYAAQHPERIGAVLAQTRALKAVAVAAEMRAMAESADLSAHVAELEIPIFARVGMADRTLPPSASADLVRLARRGALKTVPNVGHALLEEDAQGSIAAVVQSLAR
jgi:pimeloyl-ACP methyl ester carboxylesterase